MHCPENHVRPSHLPVGLGANLILGAQSSILFPAWGKAITSSEVVVASVAVSSTAENIMVSSLHLPCFCSCFTLVRRLSELCGVRRRRTTVGDAEDDPSVVREEKAAREAVEKAATNTPLFARYRVPRAATASSAIATGGIRIVASDAMIAGPCLVSARWLVLLRSMWKMQRANEPRLIE